MSQIGVIVISDNVNTQAIISSLKEDKKLVVGTEQISEDGIKFIPIEKKNI